LNSRVTTDNHTGPLLTTAFPQLLHIKQLRAPY